MGVRVRYNHLPRVINRLPKAIDEEVDEAASDLAGTLKGILWVDTGLIRRVTTDEAEGGMHAQVSVGWYLGRGFYSGFQEFGTVKQAARPIVGPTAFQYEPVYAALMSRAVKRACDV